MAAISRIIYCLFFSLFAVAPAYAKDFFVQIHYPQKYKNIYMFYDIKLVNKDCTYSFGDHPANKLTRKFELELCTKFYAQFKPLFESKQVPMSDFYHPNIPMAEISFKTSSVEWSRSISLQSNRRCDKDGKCERPQMNPLLSIAEKVISLKE